MKTIILTGGNTLGHVTPGLAVIDVLHKLYPTLRIIYITSIKQIDLNLDKNHKIDKIIYFDLKFENLFDKIKKLIQVNKKLKQILTLYKPICVVSFGSIIGTLLVNLSYKKKIKSVIHEQNAVMGFGNKLVYNKASKALAGIPLKNKEVTIVGNPILLENKKIKTVKNPKKLVITSGTNGSKFFKDLGVLLKQKNLLKEYDVTFVTGTRYYNEVISKIKESNNFKIVPFINDLSNYLIDTSFIITRAGALTLSEIYYLGTNALIIPSPNVKSNHQFKNAVFYKDYFEVIKEDEFDVNKITKYLENAKNKKKTSQKTNSTTKFIEELENVTKLYWKRTYWYTFKKCKS